MEDLRDCGGWAPIPIEVLRVILDEAMRRGGVWTEAMATIDLVYDADAGTLRTYRAYAARWRWSYGKVAKFFEKWTLTRGGDQNAIKTRSKRDQKTAISDDEERKRDQNVIKTRSKRDQSLYSRHTQTQTHIRGDTARAREENQLVEEIYQAYPRKRAPAAAKRAIAKALKSGVQADVLLETTRAWAAHWKRRVEVEGKSEIRFCPYPASWYNSASYLEKTEEWTHDEKTSSKRRRGRTPPSDKELRAEYDRSRKIAAEVLRGRRD